ncbi:hypothetical protein C8Q80DRAFT_1116849 [Daedaleopsis nitida]|nr:hypothetical protein C8Q80DRAFT_1116849 [Daedaleopsis nitida]
MSGQRIPQEILDLFIDYACSQEDRDGTFYDPDFYYTFRRTLCLVSSQWLSRARRHLYCTIRILRNAAPNRPSAISLLWRTLSDQPHLAALVKEFHVFPAQEGVPTLFMTPSARLLQALKTVTIAHIDWYYPPRYDFARFPAVTDVRLCRVHFQTVTDMFRVVWSLPHLEVLDLHEVTFDHALSVGDCRELRCTRPPRACAKLRELTISSDIVNNEYFPPVGAFGTSVRRLSIRNMFWAIWDRVGLRDSLASMPLLEELAIGIRFGGRDMTACFPEALLSVLSPDSLRSLSIDMVPAVQTAGGYSWSRQDMVEALTGSNGAEPPFARFNKLANLDISLLDSDTAHDWVWWSTSIRDRIPERLCDAVHVSVQLSHIPHLWPPESGGKVVEDLSVLAEMLDTSGMLSSFMDADSVKFFAGKHPVMFMVRDILVGFGRLANDLGRIEKISKSLECVDHKGRAPNILDLWNDRYKHFHGFSMAVVMQALHGSLLASLTNISGYSSQNLLLVRRGKLELALEFVEGFPAVSLNLLQNQLECVESQVNCNQLSVSVAMMSDLFNTDQSRSLSNDRLQVLNEIQEILGHQETVRQLNARIEPEIKEFRSVLRVFGLVWTKFRHDFKRAEVTGITTCRS